MEDDCLKMKKALSTGEPIDSPLVESSDFFVFKASVKSLYVLLVMCSFARLIQRARLARWLAVLVWL
jgi:hypothetical protein